MKGSLQQRFSQRCEAALQARPERDVDPAIEAFGYVLWLSVLGEREAYRKHAPALLKLARRAELALSAAAVRHDVGDGDEATVVALSLRRLVRAARGVLEGKDVQAVAAGASAVKVHPSAGVLVRMLDGRADGLTVGRYALHVAGCERCREELAVLGYGAAQARAPAALRAAAKPTGRVRAPSEGTVIARKRRPAVEAVLFRDPDAVRLALYATDPVPLRFVAEGATTEEAMQGYWQCRIDDERTSLRGSLCVGDDSTPFEVNVRRRGETGGAARRTSAGRRRTAKRKKSKGAASRRDIGERSMTSRNRDRRRPAMRFRLLTGAHSPTRRLRAARRRS